MQLFTFLCLLSHAQGVVSSLLCREVAVQLLANLSVGTDIGQSRVWELCFPHCLR